MKILTINVGEFIIKGRTSANITGYTDLISDDKVTFLPGGTTIDHVFYNEMISASIEKIDCTTYFDHAIIVTDISIN